MLRFSNNFINQFIMFGKWIWRGYGRGLIWEINECQSSGMSTSLMFQIFSWRGRLYAAGNFLLFWLKFENYGACVRDLNVSCYIKFSRAWKCFKQRWSSVKSIKGLRKHCAQLILWDLCCVINYVFVILKWIVKPYDAKLISLAIMCVV